MVDLSLMAKVCDELLSETIQNFRVFYRELFIAFFRAISDWHKYRATEKTSFGKRPQRKMSQICAW